MERIPNVHPGEILLEEFLEPLKISQNRLALDIRVPPNRISEIIRGKRGVTADTALRLGRYFNTSPELWLNLQASFDLEEAQIGLGPALDKIEPVIPANADKTVPA